MTLPQDYLSIDTPENVAFGYDVAGIGSRFLAAFVDTLLIVVLQAVVNLTLVLLVNNIFDDPFESDLALWLFAIFGLISFAFFWGYYILFEMIWNGQSPGKRWVGLRVLRMDGTPITLPESVIRNLVRLVDFLPVYYGVGVVTMFVSEQSRRLGDMAAGTLVVHDRSTITLDSLATPVAVEVSHRDVPAEVAALPLERLTDQSLQLVEDFLRRQKELANSPSLALNLVRALYKQMALPEPDIRSWQAETLLADIAYAHRQRRGA